MNDYTGWFAGSEELGGEYFGYDGPYPPPNDLRTHHYAFRLFALGVDKLDLPAKFSAADVRKAAEGQALGEAHITGNYSLNPKVLAG